LRIRFALSAQGLLSPPLIRPPLVQAKPVDGFT
jgi:hypothetical protein